MESGFFLNVVVGEGAAVLKLFTSENQALLIWRDTLFILDLRLDVVDGIRGLDFESDGLASEGLDDYSCELVKTSSHSENEMWRGCHRWVCNGVSDLQICIPPRRRRTRWRVDSFWML